MNMKQNQEELDTHGKKMNMAWAKQETGAGDQ